MGGNGWLAALNDTGYMDFAGSGIVHLTGGVGALVGAAIVGPRLGRFDGQDLKQRVLDVPLEFAQHSLPLVSLGTFILWFGWYGFNCGSTLALENAEQGMMAASVAMNTTLAGATAGLVVFLIRFAMIRKYDVGGFCSGILAGLVSITACCSNVESGTSIGIAVLGAIVYQTGSSTLRILGIDDPVDAFPVHGACGIWGTLCAAFFDWGQGDSIHAWSGFRCIHEEGTVAECLGVTKPLMKDIIAANFAEVGVICLWVGATSVLIFFPLKMMGLLRAPDDVLNEGFDAKKHSPAKAYELDPDQGVPNNSA